ncbi:hypothetical protein PSTG_06032 [Puccinia striiformis f. sp. tritici PST-78]|uniref:Uncharacterized protein n=1 Tax=Puccinia striiformis f. sp. tritici PST-78 TaxID=1165861 RepID=A0A0L0VN38_9BASI|nr:hypothetical protein PSTG_06032 [Puccinia striiformis f. sp. tritici PST-78]
MTLGRLIGELDDHKSWSPEIISQIKAQWRSKLAMLMALDKDLRTLSKYESEMVKILASIKHRDQTESVPLASNLIREIQRKTKIFKQLRLLRLGGHDSNIAYWHLLQSLLPGLQIPADFSDRKPLWDAEIELKSVGNSVLDQLKQLLTQQNLHAEILRLGNDEMIWINTWKYAFNVVDLLSHNHFVTPWKLKSIAQDQELAKLVVVSYINLIQKPTPKRDGLLTKLDLFLFIIFGFYDNRTGSCDRDNHRRIALKDTLSIVDQLCLIPISPFTESLLSDFPHQAKILNDVAHTPTSPFRASTYRSDFFTLADGSHNEEFWSFDRLSLFAGRFEELMGYLTAGNSWSAETRSKTVGHWAENIEKVMELDKQLIVLSMDQPIILKAFEDIKSTLKGRVSETPNKNSVSTLQREISKVSFARSLFKACQKKTDIFAQMALLKLGGQDSGEHYWGLMKPLLRNQKLPADISNESSRLMAEERLENVAVSLLAQVKKLLHIASGGIQGELSVWSRDSQDWYIYTSRYAFTVIDLLFENDFIKQTKLQTLLREQEMENIVIKYVDEVWRWTWWSNGQIKRGPWPQLHKSFKALDSETRDIIEARFLEKYAHHFKSPRKSSNKRFRAPGNIDSHPHFKTGLDSF